jgi:transcriptional antiterminator RfaH
MPFGYAAFKAPASRQRRDNAFCADFRVMSFWAAARARNESLAAVCLEERGFAVFAPKVETRRSVALLFPMHIFVLVVAQWRAIDSTPGVVKLIRFGDTPAKVPDHEIEALKARADKLGVIHLPPPPKTRHVFKRGDRVKILAGQFASFAAIHTGMRARQREIVLVTMLGATREFAVTSHLIAAQ